MTAIAILREVTPTSEKIRYRAITSTGETQSVGSTAGEALDALNAQLGEEESGSMVIVQQMRPDRFFTEAQIRRLQELMQHLQSGSEMSEEEQAEMHALIEAELQASAQRSAALADALGR